MVQGWAHTEFTDSAALGTYTYTVTMDPDNKVNETDESNNVYTGSFEVVEIQQTCFTAAGYTAPWMSDPTTSLKRCRNYR